MTPTATPEPGMIERVTDSVRDNPILTVVIGVVAFILLILLILLIRPRKKQQTGTDFLSAQTGFYQMPSEGGPPPGAGAQVGGGVSATMLEESSPPATDVFSGTLVPPSNLQLTRSPAMARLGANVALIAVPFFIGRSVDDSNSLSLDEDTSVSRKHAQITFENGVFYLIDLGRSNGTYVNGKKLMAQVPTRLINGQRIIFGKNTEVIFQTSASPDIESTYVKDDPDRTDYVDMS